MNRHNEILTEAEMSALSEWDSDIYSCACRGRCKTFPCQNERDDLVTTVERIVTARAHAAVEPDQEHMQEKGTTR